MRGNGQAPPLHCRRGRLAQLVERLLYTQVAAGSSPAPPTGFHADLGTDPDAIGRREITAAQVGGVCATCYIRAVISVISPGG
jgi:hypothetical protein